METFSNQVQGPLPNSKLMHSKHIDVSYFAAGIVAYLASSGPWTATTLSKEEMTEDLVCTIY